MFYCIAGTPGYSLDQLRERFPEKVFPDDGIIEPFDNVIPYVPTEPPEFCNLTHGITELPPIDGKQQWQVTPLPDDVLQLNLHTIGENVRRSRTLKLLQTDWTQMPDVVMADEERQAWRQYRVALRQVTTQAGFPLEVEWPKPPAEGAFGIVAPIAVADPRQSPSD